MADVFPDLAKTSEAAHIDTSVRHKLAELQRKHAVITIFAILGPLMWAASSNLLSGDLGRFIPQLFTFCLLMGALLHTNLHPEKKSVRDVLLIVANFITSTSTLYVNGGFSNPVPFLGLVAFIVVCLAGTGFGRAKAVLLIAAITAVVFWRLQAAGMLPELDPEEQRSGIIYVSVSFMSIYLLSRFQEAARASLFESLDTQRNLVAVLKENLSELSVARADAESAVVAKDNFLASMSHEIRTPMNAVIGMVDLLRHSDLGAEQARMLKTVSESSQSLLAIINDILDFSKIEAEALHIEKVPMNPGEVIENAVSAVAINARLKALRLITFVDPALQECVLGDSMRLRQIVINLVDNAIKFTERGQVAVLAEWMSPAGSPAYLRLSVTDEGIGIPEEAQQSLFEAFTQAESTTTRKYGGTGLGLTICQRLIILMGGKLELQSQPGAGSTFIAEIPFESCESDSDAPRTDLAGIRVLMVVPETSQSRALRSYLEDCSAEVLETEQLGSCLELCREFKAAGRGIDLVIVGPTESRAETFALPGKAAELEFESVRFLALVNGKRATPRAGKEEMESLEANPVNRKEFIATVAYCVGRQEQHPAAGAGSTSVGVARELLTLQEAKAAGSLILVAEDNATNRNVIGRQLKLLGHTCVIVEDGAEALKSWQSGEFGLLLTDCHMPNMDGLELTESIRARERSHPSSSRLPIIAITANALEGEAQRCLDAGMDAFLSKPVDLRKLAETLNQWLPADAPAREEGALNQKVDSAFASHELHSQPGKNSMTDSAVDVSALHSLIGDDPATIKEVLQDFIDPSRQIIQEIKVAYSANSAKQVGLAAHKLKSAARSIGANALADLCFVLEQAGKSDDMDTIRSEVGKIDRLMQAVADYIEAV